MAFNNFLKYTIDTGLTKNLNSRGRSCGENLGLKNLFSHPSTLKYL